MNKADALTVFRMVCGILILIFPAFSGGYYVFYVLGGVSDALDGAVARRSKTSSERGAKLDTAADAVFFAAVAVKLLSSLFVPAWLIIWIGAIAAVKIFNAIIGIVKRGKFVAVHSVMNKLCGAAVFVLPLFLGFDFPHQARAAVVIAVCIFATAAAVHELIIILRKGEII